MRMEMLLEWQERGLNARILGLPTTDHPLLQQDRQPAATGERPDHWQMKYDAWMFGWMIEDNMRRIDTSINAPLTRIAG